MNNARFALKIQRHNSINREQAFQSLTMKETELSNQYLCEKNKLQFVYGRLLAKQTIQEFEQSPSHTNIEILRGYLRQPVVKSGSPNVTVSISHSAPWSAALVSHESFPITIDIESDDAEVPESTTIMTQHEVNIMQSFEGGNRLSPLIFWCAKESIAKFLKMGLSTPLNVYECHGISRTINNQLRICFTNFPQLLCYVSNIHGIVIATTLPKPDCEEQIQHNLHHTIEREVLSSC